MGAVVCGCVTLAVAQRGPCRGRNKALRCNDGYPPETDPVTYCYDGSTPYCTTRGICKNCDRRCLDYICNGGKGIRPANLPTGCRRLCDYYTGRRKRATNDIPYHALPG